MNNIKVSIHTPARGVTETDDGMLVVANVSIHTPARGVTGLSTAYDDCCDVSIHTPARGVTGLLRFPAHLQQFQSTLPHGE